MWILGVSYEHGLTGLAKDKAKAFEWYEKCHEAGHASGTAALGSCYLAGDCVPKCFARANTLLSDAAARGSKHACIILGDAYAIGIWGFPKDETMARRYYSMVASAALEDCSDALEEKAATWLREHPAA
jgi:TPR repeat protein